MSTKKKYVTLEITCVHCGKEFTNRPAVTSDAPGQTETIVECLHCSKNVKITIPKTVEPNKVAMIKSVDP